MTGFVATAPTHEPDPITAGDWFPSIDPKDARAVMRIDGSVTKERLVECLAVAISSVEDELDAWQQQQQALGRASLKDVPSKVIAGESRLVLLYRRAVYATAQAELVERYRELDATEAGQRRADVLQSTADDHRRLARYAIRDLLGRPRATVELL
ncbi:head completion/stabilization protein [Dyella sp. 2RAB6]|uniref:head completion/stabilization protein n=1 Tax=Dyella sp. 2RAB6 TaxID=3232992 RepID=UPI003F935E49